MSSSRRISLVATAGMLALAGCGAQSDAELLSVRAPAGRGPGTLVSPPTADALHKAELTFRYARSSLRSTYDPKLAWRFVTSRCKRRLTYSEFTQNDLTARRMYLSQRRKDPKSRHPPIATFIVLRADAAQGGVVQVGGPRGPKDTWKYEQGGWRVVDALCSLE